MASWEPEPIQARSTTSDPRKTLNGINCLAARFGGTRRFPRRRSSSEAIGPPCPCGDSLGSPRRRDLTPGSLPSAGAWNHPPNLETRSAASSSSR
jgi:hypothetical protein